MELIHIIIDKVKDVYIFNCIETDVPSRFLHYKVQLSDNFIEEFIKEINNLNYLILSLNSIEKEASHKIISKLKILSETFFVEFFPTDIVEKIRQTQEGFLFFHIDSSLSHIPWELLYDGNSFLGDKFRIGRNIEGSYLKKYKTDKSKLKILIITNPTEDLQEAEEEGTIIFETLNSEITSDVLEIQMYSGKRITKLKILSEIQNFDILHYAGHVVYDENNPNGGFLLFNNDILSSSEIQKLKKVPSLVFLNACRSAIPQSNIGLAYSFLKSGTISYIGTNWNIPDSKKTIEFAVNFYRYLFDEKTVGEALFESRKYARENNEIHDLIWASYSLYGNPAVKFFKSPEKKTFEAIRTDWNLKKVLNEFPTFLSIPYQEFVQNKESYLNLFICFKRLVCVLTGLIIESYKKLDLKLVDIFEDQNSSKETSEKYKSLNNLIEKSLLYAKRMNLINFQIPILSLIKAFILHYEDIKKMLSIADELLFEEKDQKSQEELDSLIVSFQYLLENLFIDFSLLSHIHFFYNNGVLYPSLLFKGIEERSYHVLPIFREDDSLKKFLEIHIGEICIIIENFYLSLKEYVEYEPISKTFIFKIL
ncbi:MAG: CHAT domain-containing protein [Leptonema sp. (in: bacteria)]